MSDTQFSLELPRKVAKQGTIELCPVSRPEAFEFIQIHHRHHIPPPSVQVLEQFGAIDDEGKLRGVATVGRPVARLLDDGWTVEVTRLATDGAANACSLLYAACWKYAQSRGFRRILTYLLEEETGASVRAAGWKFLGASSGGTWERPNRTRVDKHPTGPKVRYGMGAWKYEENDVGV